MLSYAFVPLLMAALPAIAGGRSGPDADGLLIDGDNQQRILDCRGGTLVVNGNGNRLTVSGCSALTVSGNGMSSQSRSVARACWQ